MQQMWFISRGATVGGSGCDLDTAQHAAFLMGHFDHCHSLLHAQPGFCHTPPTRALAIQHRSPLGSSADADFGRRCEGGIFRKSCTKTTTDVRELVRIRDLC